MNEDLLKLANIWSITKSLHKVQKQPPELFHKKYLFYKKYLKENLFAGISLLTKSTECALQRYYKETPLQVLSCEFYAILMNTYSVEHLWEVASEYEWHTGLSIIFVLE